MLKAIDVAKYFLNKDDGTLFNNNLVERSGRRFYEGNARLNKYLHIAQNLYIAQHGRKLFEDDLYAYDNGVVVPSVQENYQAIKHYYVGKTIPQEESAYLDKIYYALQNASLEELIEISHEDSEWKRKSCFSKKEEQRMNSLSNVEEYRDQYKDMLIILDRMDKGGAVKTGTGNLD